MHVPSGRGLRCRGVCLPHLSHRMTQQLHFVGCGKHRESEPLARGFAVLLVYAMFLAVPFGARIVCPVCTCSAASACTKQGAACRAPWGVAAAGCARAAMDPASSSSAGRPLPEPDRQQPQPAWVTAAQERLRDRSETEFTGSRLGASRWTAAHDLAATGEPFAPGQESLEFERDFWMVKWNLALSSARFEPQRHTLYVAGRPVQAAQRAAVASYGQPFSTHYCNVLP